MSSDWFPARRKGTGKALVKRIEGKRRFVVESKSFEITTEVVGNQRRGVIVERSQGHSSWISFSEPSWRNLLEGVEDCCRTKGSRVISKSWIEENRYFRLERKENAAGRFCLLGERH